MDVDAYSDRNTRTKLSPQDWALICTEYCWVLRFLLVIHGIKTVIYEIYLFSCITAHKVKLKT